MQQHYDTDEKTIPRLAAQREHYQNMDVQKEAGNEGRTNTRLTYG